ncbi:MAG TPA: hypothetical protein VG204_08880, partial [Terriglobia bacterium]|nr:hypothetical protein [Terriglobia bacterium]
EYSPGWYTNAICVGSSCKAGPGTADKLTAIFDPGIYYITGSVKGNCGTTGTGCIGKPTGQCQYGLYVDSNGVVRPADPTKSVASAGDGSYGTLFYFSKAAGGNYNSAFFGANAGKGTVDNFPLALGGDANYPGLGMNCPGASPPQQPLGGAPPLPSGFLGDILLGPCTGPGGTVPANPRLNYSVQGKDALPPYPVVNYHGMLMWDDRANNDINGQPSMQGGGGLLLGGNLYFHNCPEAPSKCAAPPTDYNAFLDLQGNPGSSTYVFGNITTDELIEGGTATIQMELNPNLVTNILKVALLQ